MKLQSLGKVCLAAGMLLPLAGCNGTLKFLGLRNDSAPQLAVRPIGAPPREAGAALRGREELAAGRTGAAIEQFQIALAAGENVGAAANGLGVAYARLGQYEKAYRFFTEAIAVEPGNASYHTNLSRLLGASQLAERQAVSSPAPLPRTIERSDRRDATGMLTRVSRGAVALRTTGPTLAGRATLPRTGTLGTEGFQPVVRIEFADLEPASLAASEAPVGEAASSVVAPPAEVRSRTVHFSADTRGFRPLVQFPIGRDALVSTKENR